MLEICGYNKDEVQLAPTYIAFQGHVNGKVMVADLQAYTGTWPVKMCVKHASDTDNEAMTLELEIHQQGGDAFM